MAIDLRRVAEGTAPRAQPVSEARRHARNATRFARRWPRAIAVAIALLALGTYWYATRSATVRFETEPAGGEVWIAGELRGVAPLGIDLSPGEYKFVIRHPAFPDDARRIEVRAGETLRHMVRFVAASDTDIEAFRALVAQRSNQPGFRPETRERNSTDGPAKDGSFIPVTPRGKVSVDDLRRFRFEVGLKFQPTGFVRLMRGDEVLYESAIDPDKFAEDRLLDDATWTRIAKRIRTGDKLNWGYHPGRGLPTVVDLTVEPRALIDLDVSAQPDALGKLVVARLMLDQGYATTALGTARDVLQGSPSHPIALALACDALISLEAEKSLLFGRLSKALASQPEEIRSALFRD